MGRKSIRSNKKKKGILEKNLMLSSFVWPPTYLPKIAAILGTSRALTIKVSINTPSITAKPN